MTHGNRSNHEVTSKSTCNNFLKLANHYHNHYPPKSSPTTYFHHPTISITILNRPLYRELSNIVNMSYKYKYMNPPSTHVLLGFRACVLAALTTFVEGRTGGTSAISASAWRFSGMGLAFGGSACNALRFKPLAGAASAGAALWLWPHHQLYMGGSGGGPYK